MKIRINGDVITIIANINFEALKKMTSKKPLIIENGKGEPVYGVAVSTTGSITPSGVTFNWATSEGQAACNICFKPAAENPEDIVDALSDELMHLQEFESEINTAIEVAANVRANILNTVERG